MEEGLGFTHYIITMELSKQTTSLEISKKLRELGVKQESLFYWQQGYQEMKGGVSASMFTITQEKTESKKGMRCFSAFTVAELGEMLPVRVNTFRRKNLPFRWQCNYSYKMGDYHEEKADTEADARGLILIHLIENNLIQL